MTLYFRIANGTTDILETRVFSATLSEGSFNDKASSEVNGKDFLVEVTVTDPPFNPAAEIREATVDSYDGTTATRVFTVRPKTPQELKSTSDNADRVKMRGRVIDLGFVLVSLVDTLIAKGLINPNDFKLPTRLEYQDMKALLLRLRP